VGTIGSGSNIADVWGASIALSAGETVYTGLTNVTRTFENTFSIDAVFQRYATVSTTIEVYAAVQIASAIVNQQFGTQVEGEGTVTFIIQIGYPYQLTLNNPGGPIDTVNTTQPISATTLTSVSETPATASGTYTTQTFLLTITPGSSTCVLNGIYAAAVGRFSIQCTQAAVNNGQCPQILNPAVGINLSITSSSFCGQVIANVSAVLSINSYADSSFTTPTPNFLVQPNGNAYFLVGVLSSPEVAVTGLIVSQVQIYSTHLGGTQTLYTNGQLTSTGASFSFEIVASTGVTTAFSIGMVSAFNVPRNTLDNVAVTAVIEVEYQSVNKKRMALASLQFESGTSSTPSYVSTSLLLTGSSSSFAPSVHSYIVTFIALLVVCVGFLV